MHEIHTNQIGSPHVASAIESPGGALHGVRLHGPAGPDASREEFREAAVEAAELGPGLVLRAVEVGLVVLIGLLICPPLAITVVVVAVPLLAIAIVVGLVVSIVAGPYLLVRHVREHHRKHRSSAVAHGLRRLRARVA